MVHDKASNYWGSAPDPEVYRFLHERAAYCIRSILSKSNVSITRGALHPTVLLAPLPGELAAKRTERCVPYPHALMRRSIHLTAAP